MTGQRRLGALLCLAVVGVLVAGGLVVASTFGAVPAAVYALGALLVVAVAVQRGRTVLAPPPLPPGRSCRCCTTSQHDPVRVI